MMGQWRELPFSEAVQINPTVRLERGAVYPFVDMAAVSVDSRSATSTVEREFKSGGSKFQSGDTLMARITPCLENGKIARYQATGDKQEAHGSTEFIVIRGRPNVTDNVFAYYLTQWNEVREYAISQMTGTSGRQRVPVGSLDHLNVPIPPLPEQRAIAHVLGTLDDKIELNRRMNETLEEMARALFKSWFVDFDPVRAKIDGRWQRGQSLPGLPADLYDLFPDRLVPSELGEIPEGWEVKPLDQIATFLNGLALQKFPPEGGQTLPVIKIKQLRAGHTVGADLANDRMPTEYVVRDGDVLFSWSGSLELAIWAGGKGALNQHLFKVSSDAHPKWLYYFWTRRYLEDFRDIAADKATTMGHIQRRHLTEALTVIPPEQTLSAMDRAITPLTERALTHRMEARTLAAQRDALLPKLVSGEVGAEGIASGR